MKILIYLLSFLLVAETNANMISISLPDASSITQLFDWKNVELRRGRSFGGSRSRSTRPSRRSTNKKSSSKRTNRSSSSGLASSPKRPSFGGNRISQSQAKSRYKSPPRKQETVSRPSASGQNTTYVMNHYGGYGSGLMTGYMMGSSMWYWSMPFHPAFYYGRPAYVTNADGTVSVYPPTFSFGKLLFTLLILGVIIFIIYRIYSSKTKYQHQTVGSFG
jgi:hypothetical protein